MSTTDARDREIEDLKEENKRLREALEKTSAALNCLQDHMAVKFEGRHSHYGTMTIGQILDEADAALEGEGKDHEQG